jgi:hypothetical protein
MVCEAWKLTIHAPDPQQAVTVAPVGMAFVSQLPGSLSLKIDSQTQEAAKLGLYLMLLYQISDIDYASKYP